MAVLDEDYADGFVAPLGQNTNNQTSPEERAEERGKFPIINWSDVGSQIGKELTKQLTNTSHLVPGVIQQSLVKKTQLPTVVIEVPKQSDQQTMEQNNDSKTACEVTTAVRSEGELPGNLETKPKPEIRQHLIRMLLLTYARKETSKGPRIQIFRSHNLVLPPETNPRQSTKTVCLTVRQILSRPQVKIHP